MCIAATMQSPPIQAKKVPYSFTTSRRQWNSWPAKVPCQSAETNGESGRRCAVVTEHFAKLLQQESLFRAHDRVIYEQKHRYDDNERGQGIRRDRKTQYDQQIADIHRVTAMGEYAGGHQAFGIHAPLLAAPDDVVEPDGERTHRLSDRHDDDAKHQRDRVVVEQWPSWQQQCQQGCSRKQAVAIAEQQIADRNHHLISPRRCRRSYTT